MTFPLPIKQLQFYLTSPTPCPYIPGQEERKLFAHLPERGGQVLNNMLTQHGFRRAQNIAYSPACEHCTACRSARVKVADFTANRSMQKSLRRNADLVRSIHPPNTDDEHFDLISRYLASRHKDGGMEGMDRMDFDDLVLDTSVRTDLVDYRDDDGRLMGSMLVDRMTDGPSLVYSFFEPDENSRSLGSFMILDHIEQAREQGFPFVYLGYWVEGSPKMEYKKNYRPLELFSPEGWQVWERDEDE